MEFAVVFIVFAVTYTQVFGYPAPDAIQQNISNELDNETEKLRLKLPTEIRKSFEIHIKGTLNNESDTFIISLPETTSNTYCTITHQLKMNKLRVSPGPENKIQENSYMAAIDNEMQFMLNLTASIVNNIEIFVVSYQVNDCGINTDFDCHVNFKDLGYIEFEKGLQSLESILFQF